MPRKSHQAPVPIDRLRDADFVVASRANTARQLGLSFPVSRFRQAMILVTFGISELHKRKTSGVHAARSSAVPKALLEVNMTRDQTRERTREAIYKLHLFSRHHPPTQ
jgi:hypothetical protein